MALSILGGGIIDGEFGKDPDFSLYNGKLGRTYTGVASDSTLKFWIVQDFKAAGGVEMANGLFANPISVAGSSLDNASVIKAILVSEGLSGNYGFFEEGFTYSVEGDIGIDADGNSWIYVGAGAPNKVVAAGTVPSVSGGYEQVTFNDASGIKFSDNKSVQEFRDELSSDEVANLNGGSVQDFIDNLSGSEVLDSRGTTVQDYIDGNLTPFKTVADMKAAAYLSELPEFTRIEWQGYYAQSDGGGNWGVLRFGSHTEDGGTIFSLDDNTYIEASSRGSSVNVKKFGAVGDGVSDDTDPFKAALLKYKIVVVPNGVYKLLGTIPVTTDSMIIGDGMRKVTLLTKGNDGVVFDGGGNHRMIFRDFSMIGGDKLASGWGTDSTSTAFSMIASTTNQFVNVRLFGYDKGMEFGVDSWVQLIDKCEVYACNDGISGNGEFNYVVIDKTTIHSCERAAFIGAGRGVYITNSWIELNKAGIYKINNGTAFICDNYIERNEDYDVKVGWGTSQPELVTIEGNDFFSVKDNHKFVQFHSDENCLVRVVGNMFGYYNSSAPNPLSCFAISSTNTNTHCRVSYSGNNTSGGVKDYDVINDSPQRWLESLESKSIYNGDIFYNAGTGSSIDITDLLLQGITAFRFYTTGNITIDLPSRVDSPNTSKVIRFYYTGLDTVSISGVKNNCTLTNPFTLEPNTVYSLNTTRILNGRTEYNLVKG